MIAKCTSILVGFFVTTSVSAQWQQSQQLTPPELGGFDYFGQCVVLDGDVALVGAETDDLGEASGSLFVYRNNEGGWVQEANLYPPEGTAWDYFGFRADLDAGTAVSSALNRLGPGKVYIFSNIGEQWSLQHTLDAPDPDGVGRFGWDIAIDGEWLVASDIGYVQDGSDVRGAVYIFRRINDAWEQVERLLPDLNSDDDLYGYGVAISGQTVAVAADTATSTVVYVYRYDQGIWQLQARLVPSIDSPAGGYTPRVALDADTLALGANGDDVTSGAVVVFERTEGIWSERVRLVPSDGIQGDRFGEAVSLSGDRLAVGSSRADGYTQNEGTVYLYFRDDTGWTLEQKLIADDAEQRDEFGVSVAVEGRTVFAGAWKADRNGESQAGTAYVFDLPCIADWDGNGKVDTVDLIAFLNVWSAGDLAADLDLNGIVDTRDFIMYLSAWATGCA